MIDEEVRAGNMGASVPGVACWSWDAATDRLRWSPSNSSPCGLNPPPATLHALLNRLPPPDAERVHTAFALLAGVGQSFIEDTTIIGEDEAEHCCSFRAGAPLGPGKEVRRGVFDGLLIELSGSGPMAEVGAESVRGQHQEQQALLRAFYERSPLYKGVTEPAEGDVFHVYDNPAAERFFGVRNTAGKWAIADMHGEPAVVERWLEAYRESEARNEPVHFEHPFTQTDGSAGWLSVTISPLGQGSYGRRRFCYVAEDASNRLQIERALRASEARYRALFDAAPVGLAEVGPDGRWLRVNPALVSIVGYPEHELLDRTFQDITHPDDLAVDLGQVDRMASGEIDTYAIEKRYVRKDGIVVWVHLTVAGIRKASGGIDYFVSAVEDISARKRAEEQIRLLMREVNHRSKNMLSVVHAVARQTALRSPEDFLPRFEQRIQALSASQDLLVRNDWQNVLIEELARIQLAHFADLIGHRILLDGPMLAITAASAQSLGMAFHELATNAGKYGALSNGVGRVHLRWGVERAATGAGAKFFASWSESGGPPVKHPARQGFGTVVIDQMVRIGLSGEVEVAFDPDGFRWELTCPAGRVLDPGRLTADLGG